MKTDKKVLILLFAMLVAVVSASGFASCDKKTEDKTANESAGGLGGDAPEEETQGNSRLDVKDGLPDGLDFEGMEFKILYPAWSMYTDYYFVEAQNGEVMNDAVYKRQKDVEERLNVEIRYLSVADGDISTIAPAVVKTVQSGTDEYQLALTHCIGGVTESIGFVYDWNKVPHVDFSKPWWNQEMNNELAVQNVLLVAVSDLIIFDPNVIYFNKDIIKDFALEDPYDVVRSGRWTWDKLADMGKKVTKDLNGDGKWGTEDQYGMVANTGWVPQSALQGCDMTSVTKMPDGELRFNLLDERFDRIMNTIYDIFYDNTVTFLDEYWDPNAFGTTRIKYESEVSMNSGRVLFMPDALSAGRFYRTYDVEFGILPFPKLDENQERYWSLSWNGFMIIPLSANPEVSGAVCEALAAESYKYVVPAYYDIILTSKVARDDESKEMIDIIYQGACYDFALNYTNWSPLSHVIPNVLSSKKKDYVSYVEKNKDAFMNTLQKTYDKIIEYYIDN
ncbi:MAG: extracellular solute-binding protein [Oscillospiraceae bacterium]|nr:extracellular solute-binding protein [Oscillospiraceae bacterium]